ncbi:hypothetical protein EGM70_21590 [Enterobacteriaceae bacterium 89]|nr:hypothetical protein [Enterobacteriaceae bacterium 89]
MFAGGVISGVDTLNIPEVLIGEVVPNRKATRITPTCADAQVFFVPNSGLVTVTDNRNTSLHLG